MMPPITRKQSIGAVMLLVLTAFIWGMCFVAQRSSMEYIGPFLFNGLRVVLGAATLAVVLGFYYVAKRLRKTSSRAGLAPESSAGLAPESPAGLAPVSSAGLAPESSAESPVILTGEDRQTVLSKFRSNPQFRVILTGGIVTGCALFIASNLQQIAMVSTTASKAAFITTLYIVLVPIIGIVFRQRTRWNTWVSVAIAVAGLYLLCISESFEIATGDLLLLTCAIFWSLHILFTGRYVQKLGQLEVIQLCIIQFLTTGILSLLCAPLFDSFFVSVPLTLETIYKVLPEICYAGILSSGVAFTLQAIGQKYAPPSPAAVIMSLESAFGLLGGVVLLNEVMAGREIIGCILMFIAVILAQLTFGKRKRITEKKE